MTPWVQIHQSLIKHPKVARAAAHLRCNLWDHKMLSGWT